MGQLDRLSALDATFLHQERESSHMHIGGVAVFEGACPSLEEFIEHLDGRLGGLPRYRQKLVFGGLGPRWVDDPDFDLHYHVRAAALPSPAGDAELAAFVAQVAGQRLNRRRPLWEAWLVEAGPAHFALVFKSHHAMVDGVSNFDLATVLLDLEPGGRAPGLEHGGTGGWSPRPAPTRSDLLLADARDAVDTGVGLAGRMVGAALRPGRTVREAAELAAGVGELAWAALNPAPETPLNVEIGPHRRFAVVHQRLEDYKTVKNTFGGTVNDVVLTVVSGALRRWYSSRDEGVDGLELRALVPVSVRGDASQGQLGNQLSMFRAPLPIYLGDPVACLGVVRDAMRGLKESRQAIAASTLAAAAEVAPPGVLAQASRLQFSTRLFNLLVTNIPGPQFPLYLLGRRVESMYPLPFLAEHHGLAVAIISYNGLVEYGLLGDYDALGDLDVIAEGIDDTLDELMAAAAAATAVKQTRRQRAARRAAPAGAPPVAESVPQDAAASGSTAGSSAATGSAASETAKAKAKRPARPAPARPARQSATRSGRPARSAAQPEPAGEPAGDPEPTAGVTADDDDSTADVPLMGSTVRRRNGPGSDMRAKRRNL